MPEVSEKPIKRKRKSPKSKNPEARLDYLTNLAVDEAEKRLLNGTATTQLLTTLISYGTAKAKMELKKMIMDLRVSEAKIGQMESQQSSSEMYEKALKAFASYKGENSEEFLDEEYY